MPLPDNFDMSLDLPIVVSHEFEVDLNYLVTTNYGITIEGIDQRANAELSAIKAEFREETDRDLVRPILADTENYFDDLKVAARNLAMVALVTRLQHWASAYARRFDSGRETGRPLENELGFLNSNLGTPPEDVSFFCKLAEVRHSVIHNDAQPQWTYKGNKRNVDTRYVPNGYRVEISDEDLAEAIEKAITLIKWYDERLVALHK